jgi:hypothetical protein
MAAIESVIGSTEPKHFVEQRRRSIVIDYLLATSTHGLRSVGRAYSIRNRVFWVIIFTVASGLMLYFVVSAVLQYFAYSTQTSIEVNLDRKMPFPAVTVCSANPFRYDKMNESLVNYFYQLYPPNTPFTQDMLNSFAFPLMVDLFNTNDTKQIEIIGFQLSDMLLACTYNGIDCSNAFISFISSALGNCYTFNWKTSTPFYTIADFGNTLVLKEGLTMTFYIPRESYFPIMSFDTGLTILLHDNDELPVPNENGLRLQPGLSHLITYRKSETTFLPSPYTTCTSKVGDDLRVLYQTTFINYSASTAVAYSESVCGELCEQAYIFSQCSCILPLPFYTRYVLTLDGNLAPANCCSFLNNQAACAYAAQQQFSANDQLQTIWCSHCASQCKNIQFTSDLSSQEGPSDADKAYWAGVLVNGSNESAILVPPDFAQNFNYYFDRNYLKVLVTCGSKYVTEYNQEAKLTLIDTFSAIGGQTGL